jgi:hypothetical protein
MSPRKTKRVKRSRKNRSLRRRRTHSQRGGYSSASSYGESVNGTIGVQTANAYGRNLMGNTSNTSVGVQHQNTGLNGQPSASNLALIQSAGRKRRTRGKRGGYFPIISQAAAPAALLAMQQSYRRGRNPYRNR